MNMEVLDTMEIFQDRVLAEIIQFPIPAVMFFMIFPLTHMDKFLLLHSSDIDNPGVCIMRFCLNLSLIWDCIFQTQLT